MDRQHLDSFYPDHVSMENRLFAEGRNLTKVSPRKWSILILASIPLNLIGFSDPEELWFFLVLGGLMTFIGFLGIACYYAGLHSLERAELLYNTRMAGEYVMHRTSAAPKSPATPAPAPAPTTPKAAAPKPAPKTAAPQVPVASQDSDESWTCSACKTKNLSSRTTCWSCNAPKS